MLNQLDEFVDTRVGMLNLLSKLTKRARHPFAFHAVLVVKGGAAIASGYNHGIIHAEINALGKLWPSKRRGVKLWSIRVTPGGRLAAAKPCDECMAYLLKFGVKTIIYSTQDGTLERMRL